MVGRKVGPDDRTKTFRVPRTRVVPRASFDLPEGYLVPEGQAISREDFPGLYEALQPYAGAEMSDSQYEIHAKQQWTDHEPDTLTVKLVTARDGDGPYITFCGQETFLDLGMAQEVIDFLRRCILEGSLIQLDRGMTPTWGEVNGRKMG